MNRFLFVLLLALASCARPPKDGFVVVDPWGSIILRTDNEDEAWRLAAQLTNMGRVLASKPQYFVLKSPRNQGTPDGTAPEQSRW